MNGLQEGRLRRGHPLRCQPLFRGNWATEHLNWQQGQWASVFLQTSHDLV